MSRLWRAGATVSAAPVAVMVLLSGCSAGSLGVFDRDVSLQSPAFTGRSDLDSVLTDIAVLARLRGVLMANCLDHSGFSEARDAISQTREGFERYKSGPLRISSLDLGPSTPSEARQYGVLGSIIPIDADEVGYVISEDSEFDRSSEACAGSIAHDLPSLAELQHLGASLADRVRQDFIDGLMPELEVLLVARFACVKAAGFEIDPRLAAAADDWNVVLSSVGIEEGKFADPPKPPEVPSGEVRAFPPPPLMQYEPTKGEVNFSMAYVRCGDEQGFSSAVEAASLSQRQRLRQRYAVESSGIARKLGLLAGDVAKFREEQQ